MQVDTVLDEIYTFYEGSTAVKPTIEERLELITRLDSESKGFISENDFVLFEEKCLKDSLQLIRSQRISVNITLGTSHQCHSKANNTLSSFCKSGIL